LNHEKALVSISILCVGLIASDFVHPTNQFWSRHQLITGLVTGVVLALLAIAGVDRLIARREARRWKPLSLMMLGRIERGISEIEESLLTRTQEYCLRHYGFDEIPEDRHYFQVLPEALQDPASWEPGTENPGLLEEVLEQSERSSENLETWAPVLIADSRLATIASNVIARHEAHQSIFNVLMGLDATLIFGEARNYPRSVMNLNLVVSLVRHRKAVDLVRRSVAEFRAS
jgi:hypothetical protein